MSENIQLTNVDKNAIWLDKEGNKILMSDLEDSSLQKALEITQNNRVKYFIQFKNHSLRELQLKKEAKNRNMEIVDIDYKSATWMASRFCEFKSVMETAYNSIVRKIKQETSKV